MKQKKFSLKNPAFQSILTSLLCIVLGLLIGYIVLLMINPAGAGTAIKTILLNFLSRSSQAAQMKALGNTLAKTAPLLMCALSICFCYKVGLFNIGAPGQYEAGACIGLYAALAWHLNWVICLILAGLAGAVVGAISGALKAYRNVNEVISIKLMSGNKGALIPSAGLNALFANNKTVTLAIPLAILFAILIWMILAKTKFGYELKATGYNKEAAKYAGMKEKQNIIITLAIGGALAGIGASFLFLTGYQEWSTTQTSVPMMGFNGIAATFLGGLHPIGTIFASFFIQSITDGGALINKSVYPSQISDLISSIIIYLCGFVLFFKYALNTWISKRDKGGPNVNDVPVTNDDAKKEGGDK